MNLFTANIFNAAGSLICVFSTWSPTAAANAFQRSEHITNGCTLYVYDSLGNAVLVSDHAGSRYGLA